MDLFTITKIYESYICDPTFVYKSCKKNWIIILKILHDTLTNENRLNINNNKCAKFRANKLYVVLIFNKFDPTKTIPDIVNDDCKDDIIKYKTGKIVYPNKFDHDLDKICSDGIHYFKSIEPAFYYQINKISSFTGDYIECYDSGSLFVKCKYKFGNKYGKFIAWYENGNKKLSCTIYEGKHYGEYEEWYENGNKKW